MLLHVIQKDTLPWRKLSEPLAKAEDNLARLDERLATSPIRDGFIARAHLSDSCASVSLEGELVSLEDLVLHDANMDVCTPTPALARSHSVLRLRRRIADREPEWALSPAGLSMLTGRAGQGTLEEDHGESASGQFRAGSQRPKTEHWRKLWPPLTLLLIAARARWQASPRCRQCF